MVRAPKVTHTDRPLVAQNEPIIEVQGQFLKDISFENPRSLSIDPNGLQPNINITIENKASSLSNGLFEVTLNINVEAKQNDKVIFILEMAYGGVFSLTNIQDDSVEPVLLIECPRLLFPFARNIVADLVREGGFPPLLLNPIDFAALYKEQKKSA